MSPPLEQLLRTPNTTLFWGRQTWVAEPGLVLAHGPCRVQSARTPDEVAPLLDAIEAETRAGRWVAGFVSYEGGLAFDLPCHEPSHLAPLAWLAAYDADNVLRLDPDEIPDLPPPAGLSEAQVALNVSRAAYGAALDRIHEYIAAGDTYQVNFTCHARFAADWDPLAYFLTLARSHPVPYAAYLNLGDRQVLSLSPELFLQRRGPVLASRPMKGTRKRGRTLAEDAALAEDLVTSVKDRAENLMILDMVRNDLGRVGRIGSVRVPAMFTAEKYRSVWQMTSNVEVDLDPAVTLRQLFAATFPGASITGAPKRRTMEIIRELEAEPRGLYCGAIGLFGPAVNGQPGDFTCNLPIRTLVHRHGQFDLGIGAGILWDSQTGAEYEETLLKSRFAFRALPNLRLFETLLLPAAGDYLWREEHLARLARSAEYFDFPCDVGDLRLRLEEHAAASPDRPQVVRLELDGQGRATLTPRALAAAPDGPVRVRLAAKPVAADNPLLAHKTNQRALYDSEREAAVHAGFFEVVFTNQAGELTEGAITNLFLQTAEGWVTPPVSSGLLPGVWRQQFLADVGARETPVTVAMLRAARAVVIGNSVRGALTVGQVVGPDGEVLFAAPTAMGR